MLNPFCCSFYMYHPQKAGEKPYLFVPSAQVQALLDHINEKLGIALSIPPGVNSDRFLMTFLLDGTPRPRYFKRVRDESDLQAEDWPEVDGEEMGGFQELPVAAQQAWIEKLSLVKMPSSRQKNKGEKSAQKRADRQHMLEETQDLLRLREGKVARNGNYWQDVVFVCIDVEAIELTPNPISEVGIAILDSKDIRNVRQGPCGSDWWKYFKCHHLRIKEYSGLINYRYIQGCPDHFDFG